MKSLFLLAGAAALGVAGPAVAAPHGHGHGNAQAHQGNRDNGRHVGQSRAHHQRLSTGQRYQSGYGTSYSYTRIPTRIRTRYHLNSRYRYYYDNGYYYAVDPTTMVVQQVISALLR